MFENLTERLNSLFTELRRRGKLSAADVDAAMREVRLALLDADVYYTVVKDFVARVRERSVGAEVSKALNPAQMVIKIVNEELIATLGTPVRLNLSGARPHVIMLAGLQGSPSAAEPGGGLLGALGDMLLGKTGPRGGHHPGAYAGRGGEERGALRGSSIGREITRGVLGSILGGRRRR